MNRICNDKCDRQYENTAKCFGCNTECHNTCYGITKTIIRATKEVPNILFMCDECLAKKWVATDSLNNNATQNEIEQSTFNKDNASIFKAIGELKSMVIEIQGKMNRAEKPSYRSILTGDFGSVGSQGGSKRKRFGGNVNFGDGNFSTPTGRTKTTITGSNVNENELLAVEIRKSIFVSQLNPSTSEESIVKYVKRCLNDTDNKLKIQAVALVPKEKNRNELNFISFKINIPESSFEAVLKPELWPQGVVVREFVIDNNRRHRPSGFFLPPTPRVNQIE